MEKSAILTVSECTVLWPVTHSWCCVTPTTVLFWTILLPKGNPCPHSAVTLCGPSAPHCHSSALVFCGFACSRHCRSRESSMIGLLYPNISRAHPCCSVYWPPFSFMFEKCFIVGVCTSLFPFILMHMWAVCTSGYSEQCCCEQVCKVSLEHLVGVCLGVVLLAV